MNFIFISPNFPTNYYQFIEGLSVYGINVLGIGDSEYDALSDSLKSHLTEYYKVNSLNDYDAVYRAVAFFAFKYGKIDWIESNNEYWMEQDAKLRDDFNITTGIHSDTIMGLRYKSAMKAFYKKAHVKTARYHLLEEHVETAVVFAKKVGSPCIIKPDNGMGASHTSKITCEQDIRDFYHEYDWHEMIMEEFVDGYLVSFDGVADSKRNILYCTAHYYPQPIMNILHDQTDCYFYSFVDIPEKLKKAGENVVKAFQTNSRFFHTEYFILKADKEGLGKKGDVLGLEVNMRPPGGKAPDMINFAGDVNIYQLWADMVVNDATDIKPRDPKYCCVYAARRFDHTYRVPLDEIRTRYKAHIVEDVDVDPGLSDCMGDHALIARFDSEAEAQIFIDDVVEDHK